MKKSVYSLVLNDRVVEELDQLAYRQGTSRSALINRILAEGNALPLVKRIDREKIEELLEKLHNKNSYITG